MAYWIFLALFLGLPLAALAALAWRDGKKAWPRAPGFGSRRSAVVLLIHVVLALAYTSPWDNYLVATGVWSYDAGRVVGIRLGWVPAEEYSFFALQALLTGLWWLWLARRLQPDGAVRWERPALRLSTVSVATLLWAGAVVLLCTSWQPGTYLALELAWALPPLSLQLGFGADILWRRCRLVSCTVLVASLYLSAADALAIASHTWTISPALSTGLLLGGVLPIEEAIFFVLTNALIAFGVTLGLAPESQRRLESWRKRGLSHV